MCLLLLVTACGRLGFERWEPEPIDVTVEKRFPTMGATWLGMSEIGSDAVCTSSSWFYDGCTHAAELLSVRADDELTACEELVIGDELGAFDWQCTREGTQLVFLTAGLTASAGLATLVEPDRWKPNRFTARRGAQLFYASTSEAWWSDPVVPLPDNSLGAPVILGDIGTIYTLAASRATMGYSIGADRIAVVTLGDAVLRYAGGGPLNCGKGMGIDARCVISTGDVRRELWIEANLDGGAAPMASDYGILMYAPSRTVFRNVRTRHHARDGMYLEYAESTFVNDLVATDNGGAGYQDYSSFMRGRHMVLANNVGSGLDARSFGQHGLVDVRSYNNGGDGVRLSGDASAVLVDVVVANNGGGGLFWTQAYDGGAIHELTAINNAGIGAQLGSLYSSTVDHLVVVNSGSTALQMTRVENTLLAQLVLAHNAGFALTHDFGFEDTFRDNLLIGANAGACTVTNGTNPGIDAACTSSARLVSAIDLTSSFVGPVRADDPRNSSDVDGRAPATTITDWTNFASGTRVWGRDSVNLDAAARGNCTGGATCRIWDISLSPQDTVLRSAVRIGTPTSDVFVAGAACPPAVHGDVVMTNPTEQCYPGWPAPCPRAYLRDAAELLDDHVGNDDGLCESNEACLYAPNFGPDRGRGGRIGPCQFEGGAVAGVTMYGHKDP